MNLTDLKTMAKADPYNVSDSVNPDKADDANTANTRSALRQLADSRHDIMRMATSILRNEIDSDEVSSLDPQALARQDANDTASHSNDPTQWIGSLLALHDDMALRSMSGSPRADSHAKSHGQSHENTGQRSSERRTHQPIGINIRVQRIRENANHRQQ